jgi:hypothetical protein
MVSFRTHHRLIDDGDYDGQGNDEACGRNDQSPSPHIFPPTQWMRLPPQAMCGGSHSLHLLNLRAAAGLCGAKHRLLAQSLGHRHGLELALAVGG